jgi:hypothetical protein
MDKNEYYKYKYYKYKQKYLGMKNILGFEGKQKYLSTKNILGFEGKQKYLGMKNILGFEGKQKYLGMKNILGFEDKQKYLSTKNILGFEGKQKYLSTENNYQQTGDNVLSIISKSNLEVVYYLNLEYGSKMELIDEKYNSDDNTAIQFMTNYDDYTGEVEQEEFEQAQREQEGDYEDSDDSYQDYDYPDEGDDPLDSLKQIDIESWVPVNKTIPQYYLVKLTNDDTQYLLKLISSDYKYEFNKNIEEYSVEYGKLKNMKNILSPQYLFKDANNIVCGYLFKFDEDFISLSNYLKSGDVSPELFLQILDKICDCYISVFRCGLKPCIKNNKIVILNSDNGLEVFLTGSDGLLGCKQDIEEETVRDIAKFFTVGNLSPELKESYFVKKIFKIGGESISLKNNIVTVKGLKELIGKLLNSK